MVPLARSNKYLKSHSLLKVVSENASASSAFEGVRAAARGGAVSYSKSSRNLTARAKKRARPTPYLSPSSRA